MSITIKDIAKQAGVSISTVSRVINGSKPVSNEIRQKVMQIIEETGYMPNPIARSLVMKKSQLIGVVVPDISNTFINEILSGIEEIGRMYNYDILLCSTYGDQEQELRYLNLLKAKQVEGIVFMTWELDEKLIKYISNIDTPVVLINRNTDKLEIPSVSIDNFKAAYEITEYLINKGHKEIALMRRQGHDAFSLRIYEGYKKALEDNDIPLNENIVYEGEYKIEKGYELTEKLIEGKNVPTAIFASNDVMAIGAINALFDNGYNVPNDVSVVGFNDIELSSIYRPKLTTIHQPIYDIGAVAIRMIIKKINEEELDCNIVELPHDLIERESVKSIK
ncbi:LacI family DNA-binding transcriptional regulator [Anaeromicrobium sediminis]|uniref:LacI family transcriptional regulator n=1 Tax=Anaeromicrobium sediminis TaxID=1478221 RepID=A0A267MHZ6_9FIRM|nr:LacI family DNA-binding transcriptional regulator [Anaeromicrobium sediminis]PAB59204.1 LacI family transcriptional regulator [Anaeromicrobium sediminis]